MRFFALLVLFAAGCTTYQAGVEANWASPSTLKVSGAGNKWTADGRIEDYVMLKAAEKGLAAGYRYFVVANSKNTGSVSTHTVNTPYNTTVSVHTYGGYYGPGTTFATATTTGGPQSFSVYKPGRDAVFLMFDERPRGYRPGQYFDAVAVYNQLGPQYLANFQPLEVAPEAAFAAEETEPVYARRQATGVTEASLHPTLQPTPSKTERTLDEIYESLSDDEKFIAENMSSADRVNYLYTKR